MKDKAKLLVLLLAILGIIGVAVYWGHLTTRRRNEENKRKQEELAHQINETWKTYNHSKVEEIAVSEDVPIELVEELYQKNNPAYIQERLGEDLATAPNFENFQQADDYFKNINKEYIRLMATKYDLGHRDVAYLQEIVSKECFNSEQFYLEIFGNGMDDDPFVEAQKKIIMMRMND